MYIPSIACEVISFNSQRQLCHQTCAVREEIFQTNTRISTIQSRRLEKKAKNHVKSTPKNVVKVLFHYPPTLPFNYSCNSTILKAFPKAFLTKKKSGHESKRKGEESKQKFKVKTAVSIVNPKTFSKFWFLCLPQLRRLIRCIQTKGCKNSFVVSFSS